VALAAVDDIPSAADSPHLTVDGAEFEVVQNRPTGRARWRGPSYTLIGPRGKTYDTVRLRERGITTQLMIPRSNAGHLFDENGESTLLHADEAGGLSCVLRGSPQWRAAVNEALVAAGKLPLPTPGELGVGFPIIEIPRQRSGWKYVVEDLDAHLTARSTWAPTQLATPYGTLLLAAVTPHGSSSFQGVAVSGELTLGGRTYTVAGDLMRMSGALLQVSGNQPVPTGTEQEVRRAILAALDDDGPHVELWDLVRAREAAGVLTGPDEWSTSWATHARERLLLLSTHALPVAGERAVARAWATAGFTGNVQELHATTAQMAKLPPAAQTAAMRMAAAGIKATPDVLLDLAGTTPTGVLQVAVSLVEAGVTSRPRELLGAARDLPEALRPAALALLKAGVRPTPRQLLGLTRDLSPAARRTALNLRKAGLYWATPDELRVVARDLPANARKVAGDLLRAGLFATPDELLAVARDLPVGARETALLLVRSGYTGPVKDLPGVASALSAPRAATRR